MVFGKPLYFMLIIGVVIALSAWGQQEPLTQDQVRGLVRSRLGNDSGAKLIEQRGISFLVADDFLQSMQAAGASDAFLRALRSAKSPQTAAARVTVPADAGSKAAAKGSEPKTPESPQAELQHHTAQGLEDLHAYHDAEAEREYRAAVRLDPQNPEWHVDLSRALRRERKTDEAIAEAREALRLDPASAMAHFALGNALGDNRDWDGMIAEEREAVRLKPNNELALVSLGMALYFKGDWDGATAEYREALRLNPNNANAHSNLGAVLQRKGDREGAIEEYRAACTLDPNNTAYKQNLANLSR